MRANMVFLLSVLGAGLFSYYQGRSHYLVLPLVWWPVWLLLTLFLDELVSRLRAGSWRLLHWLAAAGVVGVLAGYAGIALVDLRFLGEWVHGQLPGTQASAAVRREAACLRSITPPGEGMLILSGRGGILHLLSGVPPVSRSSYVGMLLLDDYAELSRVLEERPTVQVFIEKSVFYLDWACNIGHRLLIDSIQQRYELVEEMEDGYLFRRANFLLRGGGRSLCRIRSRDGRVPRGLVSDVLTLGSAFTVEVLVKPEAEEALWATVIGNQSLWLCNTGFVIQQQARNVYVAVLGNGVGWEVGPGFQLVPGRWHYLALVVQQKAVQVYVDGRLAATYGRTAPWPGASGQPVYVGNWFGEDRPFKGLIKEARVVDRAVPMSEVVSRYERIKPQLR